jgi:hypothetical protein
MHFASEDVHFAKIKKHCAMLASAKNKTPFVKKDHCKNTMR